MISIDWENKIISIPKNDLTLIQSSPTEVRELSLVTLFGWLRDAEMSDTGMLYPFILEYTKPASIGGITLAPVVKITNGYTITFEDGQYAVNLVGANSNLADNANVNQVSVRTSNSAGLVQTREIEHAAFNNQVVIDVINGVSGTTYPIGTLQKPVNNLADAKFIANLRGFNTFFVKGTLTIGATDNVNLFTFDGLGQENTAVVLTSGCTTSKTSFRNLSISGRQNGETHYFKCDINELTNVHCVFDSCRLIGPMRMHQSYADTTVLINCYTGDVAGQTFVVDLTNSPCHMTFQNFYGKMQFTNMNKPTAGVVTVNMGAGKVLIDSTCVTGAIKVRGTGELLDSSAGTIVDNDTTMALLRQDGTLTDNQNIMLQEIFRLMGLDPTRPLVVTQTNRAAGAEIDQAIVVDDINKTTTVTRQ